MGALIDELVLTASNRAQARGYELNLRAMEREGRLRDIAAWRVIPDPPGPRVGSGAATMLALRALGPLRGRRVAIVHSGGDSRRLPAYAALGKAFLPLPFTDDVGRGQCFLDLVLRDLSRLMVSVSPGAGRVIIAAGDVYVGVGPTTDVSGPGVVGVAFPAPFATAQRHGVFVLDRQGRVTNALQKPTLDRARRAGAVRRDGRLLVDTGIVSLDAPAAAWLSDQSARLGPVLRGLTPAIDLYEHTLPSLVRGGRGLPAFRVEVAPRCAFMHIGTTRQLLAAPGALKRALRTSARTPVVINSHLAKHTVLRAPAFVESSRFDRPASLPGANVVIGWPSGSPGRLARGVGLTCLPIGADRWAVVSFGDRDDFKTDASRGGTILNRPLARLERRSGPLWSVRDPRTAWDARLWVVGTLVDSYSSTAWLRDDGPPAPTWRRARRRSLRELVARVNRARLVDHREMMAARWIDDLPAHLAAHPWTSAPRIAAGVRSPAQARRVSSAVAGLLRRERDPVAQSRLWRVAQRLIERFPQVSPALRLPDAPAAESRAFAAVVECVAPPASPPGKPRAGVLADQVVWVTCPARIDLAGGWSDTPPICNALGGKVLNAAITLNGQYPIQVVCRRSTTPGVRLTSIDLGRTVLIRSTREATRHTDPHDWAALPKAALVASGLTPPEARTPIADWLEALGGGIELTFFSALPKGSGLGTSSIFGAAMLAGLARLRAEPLSHAALVRRTSRLEQLMTTGGGWQDQAGGIYPGVKLLTTDPGPDQSPRVERLPDDGGLRSPGARARMLLYYTGQRRLARNILRNVVGRFLDRDPEMERILTGLKSGADRMHGALLYQDLPEFAKWVGHFWNSKKAIDAGATNPLIQALIARVAPHLDGYSLPGAGGGGFLFMIARDERAAKRVRRELGHRPPNDLARFYDFEIDPRGLGVSVL